VRARQPCHKFRTCYPLGRGGGSQRRKKEEEFKRQRGPLSLKKAETKTRKCYQQAKAPEQNARLERDPQDTPHAASTEISQRKERGSQFEPVTEGEGVCKKNGSALGAKHGAVGGTKNKVSIQTTRIKRILGENRERNCHPESECDEKEIPRCHRSMGNKISCVKARKISKKTREKLSSRIGRAKSKDYK